MTLNEFKWEVYQLAKSRGYTDHEIECFVLDIEDAYYEGLTVQECFDREF